MSWEVPRKGGTYSLYPGVYSVNSSYCKAQSNRKDERFVGSALISNYSHSDQCYSPPKSVSLPALSVFLGQDAVDSRMGRDFWGHFTPGGLPPSSLGSSPLTATALRQQRRRIRPALPGAGEGLGVLLSRWRMLLCLTFNAALAPGGCRQICLFDRLC